jgi:hypothetical protein
MQTHQIQVSGAKERVHEIRSELFAFPEVLDVFATGRPDALVVVYWGRPRPGEWLRALRELGYRTPARGHARWPRPDRLHAALRRAVVEYADVGARNGNQTTTSSASGRPPGRQRDAA